MSDPIDNDMNTTLDPAEDGLDFYDTLEGMRATIDDPAAVSATDGFARSSQSTTTTA